MLPSLSCPKCGGPMPVLMDAPVSTCTSFSDCLRRCEGCGIGASNAASPSSVTYIQREPLHNIPRQIREGADVALANALNVRNRLSKRKRFGFSTSEDAITWVVFVHLLRSGALESVLQRIH